MSIVALSPAKQLAFERVRGLWVAIPTPFTDEGALDEAALRASVDYYVEALRVDGIFCGGVMGEFWSLTVAERRTLHAMMADAVAGRVPLMAQTSHHVFDECVGLTNHAAEIGVDLAIIMNPYYPPRPSDDLVRAWYHGIAERTEQPTFLFNTAYSGYSVSPELISELAEIDIICGIKNPKPRSHLLDVQDRCGNKIVVCDASEEEWLDLHLNHGFQALMSTPAIALFQTPTSRPIANYTSLADDGRLDEAWEVHATLEGHRRAFQRWMRDPWLTNLEGAIPIAQLKAWLGLMGLPQGPVRLPLIPLGDEERAELTADLDTLGLLAGVEASA